MTGNVLQEVEDNKYMGVVIQNNLKWDKHSGTLHLKQTQC